jgi:hypothetical protein
VTSQNGGKCLMAGPNQARPMPRPDGRAGSVDPDQVRRIRFIASVGQELRKQLTQQPTLAQIAEAEGLSLRTVRAIVSYQRYKWVKP